ncbi:hypothetical protein R80B4_01415 [Fibrobacteres bacterium R8-0-B4]
MKRTTAFLITASLAAMMTAPAAHAQIRYVAVVETEVNAQSGAAASRPHDRSGSVSGVRSRASIQCVVMQNAAALRYAYNKRLREKPGLSGEITVTFAIDGFGRVIFAETVKSTMADPEFESAVVSAVKAWEFGKIGRHGGVAEVTYPFIFSQ